MKMETFVLGACNANCYAVSGDDFAFVIDPGDVCEELLSFAKRESNKKYKYILLTHCHADHIAGAQELKKYFGGKICISSADAAGLENTAVNLSQELLGYPVSFSPDLTVDEGSEIELGSKKITVMLTPGHTMGSVCFLIDDMMFSGDTLFLGSFGQTTFPTGSVSKMFRTLKRISNISEDLIIYPGHGSSTTLLYEKQTNAYLGR